MNGLKKIQLYVYIHIHTIEYTYTHTHTRDRILFSHRKEWNFAIWSYVDGSGGHYTRWNMSDKEKYNVSHAAKSLQSSPTLCDPIDGSPPSSPVLGIFQARTLEWVAISFSNAWKWKKVKSLSHVRLLATPWTAAHQGPLSMGFSRQEYWSGVPLPSLNVSHMWI